MATKEDILNHIKELEPEVELKNSIERLMQNEDFKKVILEGFCQDEMQRNLGLAVCEKLPEETRNLCNQLAKSSAALINYLNTKVQLGRVAEDDIAQHREYLATDMVEADEENN